MTPPTPTPLHRASQNVLVTGATGFVGQAVVERLLTCTDANLVLLVRDSGSTSAAERMKRVFAKSAFRAWRRRVGSAVVDAEIARRVRVIAGDLGSLGEGELLPPGLDVVIHSASSVNFDDPIDAAFTANVAGPAALYEALRAGRQHPHVVHVSTCYVNANRSQVGRERTVEHTVDWRSELDRARALGARRAIDPQLDLVEAGRRRAAELGWTDVYTLSKAMGERAAEQLWGDAHERLTIVRPTIIESALNVPEPGWLDGFKVADPIIAAYAKDRLDGFPGRPSAVLDVVPVDLVVDAIMAATAVQPAPGEVEYLQVGTGMRNPLLLGELHRQVEHFYDTAALVDRHGEPVRPKHIRFSDPASITRRVEVNRRGLSLAGRLLSGAPTATASRWAAKASARAEQLSTMRTYIDLYQTYCMSTTVYDDARAAELIAAAPDELVTGAQATDVDWEHYFQRVHLPALSTLIGLRRPKQTAPVTPGVTDSSAKAVDPAEAATTAAVVAQAAAASRIHAPVAAAVTAPSRPGAAHAAPIDGADTGASVTVRRARNSRMSQAIRRR